jgi:hypothetical protein
MTSTLFGAAFDARDVAASATFWAHVLNRQVQDGATAEHAVVAPAEVALSGPRLAFHQVPEAKTVKNRFHLDLITTDFPAETRRLISLGASALQHHDGWTTFADPEGNEFDLIAG